MRRDPALLFLLCAVSALATCGGKPPVTDPRDLDPALSWYGTNRQKLDEFIDKYGVVSSSYDPAHKPIAIFDWDNTIAKNDVGDMTMYWMLRNGKILQPPGKNWRLTSPYLTADAVTALDAACGALADAGQPLPTSPAGGTLCADTIVGIYDNEVTGAGKQAFSGYNYRRMEAAYAWTVQLEAGYTPVEIGAFAESAISEALAAPMGATQVVGTTTENAYLRVYDQIKDLMGTMQANGFDVWINSASSQIVINHFATRVGVNPDHILGVRALLDGSGELSYNLAGCGDVPDGTNDGAGKVTGNSMITYIDGKRCWINKVIYGDSSAGAVNQLDASRRHVFAAGDSNTDTTFVRDATVLKLVINRNKQELMCNGYNNYMGKYLLNPMFIAPKPQSKAAYPCSTTACVDQDGNPVPCYDEGAPPSKIADQMDTVFGP